LPPAGSPAVAELVSGSIEFLTLAGRNVWTGDWRESWQIS
jgi:hypothetical protein